MVEANDLRQELWLWFLEHPNKVHLWEKLEGKQSVRIIAKSLRNAAKDYCQKEKANAVGYRVEDNYYYDRTLLEELLPSVIRGDNAAPILVDLGMTKSKQMVSEGGNWFAQVADIKRGIARLTQEQQTIIYLRFGDGCNSNEELGNELGVSEDAARMRVNRALNNLLNFLGGNQPKKERDLTQEEVDVYEAQTTAQESDESVGDDSIYED
jgi:DNA-directed RNA polymerase specialized sigma24 family protein